MSKPTAKEYKLGAINQVQLLIFDFLTENKGDDDPMLDAMENIATELETRKQKLINPAAPRTRKPKAALPVVTVSSEPIAHYEPDGSYVNVNAKRGRRG